MEAFPVQAFHFLGWALGFTEGYSGFGNTSSNYLDTDGRVTLLRQLGLAKQYCQQVGMRVCVTHIDEIARTLGSGQPIVLKELNRIIQPLADNMNREMVSMKFFRLSPETEFYFDKPDAFGKEVASAFPSADYDIKEAGNCLALSRGTATVFHSMRALEYGLKALASEFSVPTNHKAWGEIIKGIEDGISSYPRNPNKPEDWREYQQFYAEAAAQFLHFKSAWRDYTAHARTKYTEEEAEAIFRHVRDFLKHLAKRLKEQPTKP